MFKDNHHLEPFETGFDQDHYEISLLHGHEDVYADAPIVESTAVHSGDFSVSQQIRAGVVLIGLQQLPKDLYKKPLV